MEEDIKFRVGHPFSYKVVICWVFNRCFDERPVFTQFPNIVHTLDIFGISVCITSQEQHRIRIFFPEFINYVVQICYFFYELGISSCCWEVDGKEECRKLVRRSKDYGEDT